MTTTGIVDMETVWKEVEKDEELQKSIEQLRMNPEEESKSKWENERLLYKGRVVLSKTSSLIPILLHTFHDSILGGHSGFLRTYKRMSGELHWNGMKADVNERILEDWTMDFIKGLHKAGGVNVIMVVVDRLSKYAYFITLKHPFSAKQVAAVFIDKIIRRHDIPNSVITDRDKIFLSNFWKELFPTMGTILKKNTAFHPQTDGQTERAVYGRPPPPLLSYKDRKTPNNEVESLLKARNLAINALKEKLFVAQNRMTKMADFRRRELKFKVGEEVYLKLRPYKRRSLGKRKV
ncbi:Transposon Ty3-G Gag-Pol polyprotein [Cucumis melo var. makuwa]|uniref:Transposon Ty3-G Gag-Pol polyprotein n=1 Tax=Cucumis melo var. makuwa TaxID=1194695 RepID=A0A5D3D3B4_CUCMM|nr:Transposon Ty3-G Gag-Pol polyprotein [Cucumis melo var. makuwa]